MHSFYLNPINRYCIWETMKYYNNAILFQVQENIRFHFFFQNSILKWETNVKEKEQF